MSRDQARPLQLLPRDSLGSSSYAVAGKALSVPLSPLGPAHPLLVFVEVVATDGPVNEPRKQALMRLAAGANFPPGHTAFVTAYLDRSVPTFRRTVANLAWGTYAWFAAEPERLLLLHEKPKQIGALP